MENEAIFCPRCGAKNAASHAFCFACGTPLPRVAEPPASEPAEPNGFDAPTETPEPDDRTDPSATPEDAFRPAELNDFDTLPETPEPDDLIDPSATPEDTFRPAELNDFDAPTETPEPDDFTDPSATPEDTFRPAELNDFNAPTETPEPDDRIDPSATPEDAFRPAELNDFDTPPETSEPDDFTDLLAPLLTDRSTAQPAEAPDSDGFTDPIDPSATPDPAPRSAERSVRKAFASSASAVALTLLTVFACAMLLRGFLSYSFPVLVNFLGEIDVIFDLDKMFLLENVSFLLNLLQVAFRVIVLFGAWLALFGATKGGLTVVRVGAVAAFTACLLRLAVVVMQLFFGAEAERTYLVALFGVETSDLVWWVLTIAFAVLLPVLYLLLFHTAGGMKRVARYDDPCERVSLAVPSVFLILFGLLTVACVVLPCIGLFSILPDLWSVAQTVELDLLYWFFELILAVGAFVLAGYLLQLRRRLRRMADAE